MIYLFLGIAAIIFAFVLYTYCLHNGGVFFPSPFDPDILDLEEVNPAYIGLKLDNCSDVELTFKSFASSDTTTDKVFRLYCYTDKELNRPKSILGPGLTSDAVVYLRKRDAAKVREGDRILVRGNLGMVSVDLHVGSRSVPARLVKIMP